MWRSLDDPCAPTIEEQNRADREAEARMAAEAEIARLKAEIERLRGGG